MAISLSSWSPLSMSKARTSHNTHSAKKTAHFAPQPPPSSSSMSNDSLPLSASRAASLAGRKRPRESEGESSKIRLSRRTKSAGDAGGLRKPKDKDREAFQRGLIAVFVPNALRESLVGRMEHYNDLVAHFSPSTSQMTLAPLLPLLRALTAHVSLLAPEVHSALVSAIISLPWAAGEEKFVRVFIGFCGVLVSAQPGWAKQVVNMAVRGLRWQPVMPCSASAPISRRIFHARHHLLLAHLLSLIPTLPSVVQPLLAKSFPNKREPEVSQTTWVRNCCELIGYCPELGQRVWGMIVDRMLRIDSEITKQEDYEDDDEEEETEDEDEAPIAGPSRQSTPTAPDPFEIYITQDMPKPEDEEDSDDDDDELDVDELSSVDGDEVEEEDTDDEQKAAIAKERKRAAVKAMKVKLDGMLLYFFQHLSETMGGRPIATSAAQMAAANLASTASSSGASTPTAECPNPMSTALPNIATVKTPITPAQSLSHFQTLLTLFTRQILPTSSTQHIPFLLFFTASLTPAHTDLFLGLLVSQALYGTSTSAPTIGSQPLSLAQRTASTVYIGSIVCRAKFVTDEQARQVMTYLLAYIDGKMHQTPKPDDPPLFYAVCQAVMLIFCFRWRAFTSDHKEGESVLGELELDGESVEGEGKWMRDLDVLQKVITSDLNPLLGCNPTIVSTFAKVAHQTNFAYCFSIMEANQAHLRPASSNPTTPSTTNSRHNSLSYSAALNTARNARQANVDSGMDDYFPFDPYDLPRSKRFVESLYVQWGDVAIQNDSDDEESEEEDEEISEADTSEMESLNGSLMRDTMVSRGIPKIKIKNGSWTDRRRMAFERDNGLSSSLEGMSISPGLSRVVG